MKRYIPHALLVIAAGLLIVWGVRAELSKSDWASWVQAVGSIAAIIGAFGLGERQMIAARKLEADKRHLDDLLRTEIIQTYFAESLHVCEQLRGMDESRTPPPKTSQRVERLRELEQYFKSLPPFELPGRGVAFGVLEAPKALGDLRSAAQQVLELLKRLGNYPGVLPEHLVVEFRRAHNHAEGVSRAGVTTCEEQIASLKRLMPVVD